MGDNECLSFPRVVIKDFEGVTDAWPSFSDDLRISSRQYSCEPGIMCKLVVEIRSSVTHTLMVQRFQNWLNGAKSPKEAAIKERLRRLL